MEYPSQTHDFSEETVYRVHNCDGKIIVSYKSLQQARECYKNTLKSDGDAMITKCTTRKIRATTYEHVQGKL